MEKLRRDLDYSDPHKVFSKNNTEDGREIFGWMLRFNVGKMSDPHNPLFHQFDFTSDNSDYKIQDLMWNGYKEKGMNEHGRSGGFKYKIHIYIFSDEVFSPLVQ